MTQNIVILGTAVLWKEKKYYVDKFHLCDEDDDCDDG